jgi:glycosyltransferase involved in cell wall biosynthesis
MTPDPCESGCRLGLADCHALTAKAPRLCELVAAGVAGYADAVRALTAGTAPAAVPDPADDAPARPPGYCAPCRQAKPRVNLAEAVAITRAAVAPAAEPAPEPEPGGATRARGAQPAPGGRHPRCATCPIGGSLPACAGEFEGPAACSPVATGTLRRRSIFFSSAHHGWPRRPPVPPRPVDLVLRAYLAADTGYGQIAEWYGRTLEAAGVRVGYEPISRSEPYHPLPPWVAERVGGSAAAPVLQVAVPATPPPPGRRVAVATMWESDGLDAHAVACLNAAELVVVPCRFNAESFRRAGVTRPVAVVPLGVDPAVFRPTLRPPGGPFRFGCAGRMAHGGMRKGLRDALAAFLAAFPGDEAVELSVKVHPDCDLADPGHPRVSFDRRALLPGGMAAWLAGLDVYVCPSRGEGWGLITLQAMAVGRPVIAAPWSGTADFFDARHGWALAYDLAPAGEFYAGLGNWAVPRQGSLVGALRAAFEHPGECRAKGAAAATRAAEFPWERTGRELLAALRGCGLVA